MKVLIRHILLCLLLSVNGFAQGISSPIIIDKGGSYSDAYWLLTQKFAPNTPNISVKEKPWNDNAIGYFSAPPGFGIDEGIVLSTANVSNINNASFSQDGNTGNPHIITPCVELEELFKDMTGVDNFAMWDVSVLSFSFTALSDSISFDYIFSSYEYPLYTCSAFNDVFGFFIQGEDINGVPGQSSQNIATVPGKTVSVAINTINKGSAYLSSNTPYCTNIDPDFASNSKYYNPNTGSRRYIGHGGYTDVLKAQAQVVCGNTYTIKIAIANITDRVRNSAVFLASNSFDATEFTLEIDSDTTIIKEDCDPAVINIKAKGDLSNTRVVNVITEHITTDGTDFLPLPTVLHFNEQQNNYGIQVFAPYDSKFEGTEEFRIIFEYTVACVPMKDTLEFTIRNKELPLLFGDSIKGCRGHAINLNDYFIGDSTYTLIGDSIIPVNDNHSGWNVFSVIDDCGEMYTDSLYLDFYSNPIANFQIIDTNLHYNPSSLEVLVQNQSIDGSSYTWIINDSVESHIPGLSFTVFKPGNQSITLITFNEHGCSDTISKAFIWEQVLIHIPNAFTPNGDGVNDIFKFFTTPGEFTFEIFDRWGNKVWSQSDHNVYWTGDGFPQGVYSWRLQYTSENNIIVKPKTGTITLYR